MKKFDVYVDGACSGNGYEKSAGGWACIITNSTKVLKTISGGELNTTNNRMELRAVLEAIKAFLKQDIVHSGYALRIFSDSAYAVNGINNRWVKKWIINGWMTSNKTPVENQDLWKELNKYDKKIDFQLIKVKGHAGCYFNELADNLAKREVIKLSNEK